MTPLPLKVPADPITIAITRHLVAQCAELDVPCLIIGASARVLILEHLFGLAPGRATRDVDFAVALDGWSRFDALKDGLVATGLFQVSKDQKQRLHFQPAGIPVDIIPFGGVERPDRTIAWPPDMAIQMSVVGYDDALRSCLEIALAPGLNVRVASMPGQALLKIQAWADRHSTTEGRDARDLAILLRECEHVDGVARIYDQGQQVGERYGWVPELMGAHLLGVDAKNLASDETRRGILAIVASQQLRDRLELHMARELTIRDDAHAYARHLLDAFLGGFA